MAREEAKIVGNDKIWKFVEDVVENGGQKNPVVPFIAGGLSMDAMDAGVLTAKNIKDVVAKYTREGGDKPAAEAAEEYLLERFAAHAQAQSVAVAPKGGAAGQAK